MKRLAVIRKEVTRCKECPFFTFVQDMNASIPYCKNPELFGDKYLGSHYIRNAWETTIPDRCPLPFVEENDDKA